MKCKILRLFNSHKLVSPKTMAKNKDLQDQDQDRNSRHQDRDQDQDFRPQEQDQDFQNSVSRCLETKTQVSRTPSLAGSLDPGMVNNLIIKI